MTNKSQVKKQQTCFLLFLVIQVFQSVMCQHQLSKDPSLISDSLDLTNKQKRITITSSQEENPRKTSDFILRSLLDHHLQSPFISRQKRVSSTSTSPAKTSSPVNSTRLSPRTVKTKYGSVRGLLLSPESDLFFKTRFNEKRNLLVEVFIGIPYSAPPVSSLRWMPPSTTGLHWKGTRTLTRFPSVCPQVLSKELDSRTRSLLSNQSEDCLYLNIYVPFPGENALFNWTDEGKSP